MTSVQCPYCYRSLELPDGAAPERVRCPRCDHLVDTDTPPSLCVPPLGVCRLPAGVLGIPPGGRPSRLTSPHSCGHCGQRIETRIGRRRVTIACPACKHSVSVYAVLHHCPGCAVLLESPLGRAGAADPCPACGVSVPVPQDFLTLRADGRVSEGDGFGFECVHCGVWLQARRGAVGRLAVCPSCLWPLQVPQIGYVLGVNSPGRRGDPRQAIQDGTTMHCRYCHEEIPKRARTCPYCHQGNAAEG
jgi:hypothetical protein